MTPPPPRWRTKEQMFHFSAINNWTENYKLIILSPQRVDEIRAVNSPPPLLFLEVIRYQPYLGAVLKPRERVICQGIRKNQLPGKAARTPLLPWQGVRTEAALSARADPFVCLLNLGNNCRNVRVYLACSSRARNDRLARWPSLSRRDRSITFVRKNEISWKDD